MIFPAFRRFSHYEYDYIKRMAFLAKDFHGDQTRWFTNDPYWRHPWAVAELIYANEGDLDQVAAGYLHDAPEDCDVTLDALAALGVRDETLVIVDGLTQRDGESNTDFIYRAAGNLRTNMPKRCDTVHNISTLPTAHSLWTKYLGYLTILDSEAVRLTGGRLTGNVRS